MDGPRERRDAEVWLAWLEPLSPGAAAAWGVVLGLVAILAAAFVYRLTHAAGAAEAAGAGALCAAWTVAVAVAIVARRRRRP